MDNFSSVPHSSPHGASTLRVGLLVDSLMVSQYVYDFAQWAQSRHNIILTHVILHATPETSSGPRLARFLRNLIHTPSGKGLYLRPSKLALRIVDSFERAIIKRNKRHFCHLHKIDISSLIQNIVTIKPIASDFGSVYRFDPADIQTVKQLNLDLLLECGCSTLRGEILSASRLGIISIRQGNNQTNRGGPAGFWEVYLRQDTTEFTIQRLTENQNPAADVLMRGHVATRHYYMLNQAFVFRKSHGDLRLIIDKIASTGKLPDSAPTFLYSHKPFRGLRAYELSIYFARLCFTLLIKRLRRLLGIHYRFSVAYVPQDWSNAKLSKSIALKNRPFHYLADPFVIFRNEKHYCFVEDYDYLEQRGVIAVYELTDVGGIPLGIALKEDFHLSFPYLFEYLGDLYMCPESSKNNDIRIYKCIDFPLRWKLEKIAMDKISAADTMIFQKKGKWWIFTNIDPARTGDRCSELFIYSANSPLDTTWKPHPLNPVIVDASRARNAGLVVDGDNYFRCSQGQGFDFYGKRVLINEIRELTDTSYVESCLSVVAPSLGAGVVGTHHFHSNGKMTVFDFVTSSRIKKEGHAPSCPVDRKETDDAQAQFH